jgi:ABC-type uncharacterized transport system substrate-binding protein
MLPKNQLLKCIRSSGVAAALVVLWFPVSQAHAHPHVWTEIRSTILLTKEGLVSGVRVKWTTDPAYATVALDGLDANSDGIYQPEELAQLTAENLDALSSYGYFLHFRTNNEVQKIGKATDGVQTYNAADGRLTLEFSVLLATPLDPQNSEISLKIYDPEYYISFEYVKNTPLMIEEGMKAGCKANLMELPEDPVAAQTKSLLATKDKDWKPENSEDFGSLFAQPVVISCLK